MRSLTSLLILPIGLALTSSAFAGERHTRAQVREAAPVRAQAPARAAAPRYQAPVAHYAPRTRTYAAQPRPVQREVVTPRRATIVRRETVAPRRATIVRREMVEPRRAMIVRRETVAPRRATIVRRETIAPRRATIVRRETVAPRRATIVRRETVAPRRATIVRRETVAPRTRFVRTTAHRFVATPHIARQRFVMARNTMTRAAFLRERSREMRIARSRRVAYVAGRVVSVNNNVVMVERPTGRVVPISVRYVPAYRRVTRGSFVTLPVTYTRGNYFAYLPGVTQTYAPQYPPYQYYGMAAASPMYYDPYYYAQTAQPVAFAAPNVPDCSQPYYGDNPNQYYFTVQQYDDYCGYGNVAYYNDAGYYNGPYYDNAPYGNAPYGNSGYYGPYDGSYSPNLAGYGVPAGGVFNPYLSAANTALVSGIIVGRSGSNLIVLTDNFQPAIVNVSEAQAFGNTGSSLDVGRPIVAAGFYDPTNTLVATAIQ